MKKIITSIALLIIINGYAQTYDIIDMALHKNLPGTYFKDIDNRLNAYEGTWIYVNGNKSLKFVFVKKENLSNGIGKEDVLIGGYEYKVDGVTLVSTLPDIDVVYNNYIKHKVYGNSLYRNSFMQCLDCVPGEFRLFMAFGEPASHLPGRLIMRRINIGAQQTIKMVLYMSGSVLYNEGDPEPPNDFVLPCGTYTLVKK